MRIVAFKALNSYNTSFMNDKELFLKILRKHSNALSKASELKGDYTLTKLGIDAMSLPHLVLELEQQFYLVIPDEYLNENTFSTVNSLWNTIEKIKS